jgi:hypothetical protein
MKTNVKSLLAISSMVLGVLFLASCSKSNDNSGNIPVAGLMAFNLVPDKAGIGVTLSGNNLTGTPLSFTSYTGGYLSIYPGTRSVRAYDYFAGNTITHTVNGFDAGKYYSLFVVGANDTYSNVVANDNFDSLSTADGQAYVRYVNAIPDSSKIQVSITGNVKSAISNQAGFATVSEFAAVNPGQISVTITNGGNIQASRSITVDPSKAYTLLFVGTPDATEAGKKVQIRYIENGTLTEDAGQRTVSYSNAVTSK